MSKRLIDLFAGCGGLSLGMEKAGFEVAFASDIDPICSTTYIKNRNLKEQKMFVGDISDLNKRFDEFSEHFSDIDLVCGGPPCQGIVCIKNIYSFYKKPSQSFLSWKM